MDRNQLEINLRPFKEGCLAKGRPLADICVFEAYPGDISTSYIIQVKAGWVEKMDCSDVIDFLFDTLWETVNEDIRKYIFSIEILDNNDQLHCYSESLLETEKKSNAI